MATDFQWHRGYLAYWCEACGCVVQTYGDEGACEHGMPKPSGATVTVTNIDRSAGPLTVAEDDDAQ